MDLFCELCNVCGFLDDTETGVCTNCSPHQKADEGFHLRPYQEEAIAETFCCWGEGQKEALLVMATGLGKTIVIAEIARRFAGV